VWDCIRKPAWNERNIVYVVDDEHTDIVKAWYDGREVEFFDICKNEWTTLTSNLISVIESNDGLKLRVKPEWYENIPEDGIWCWCWDDYMDAKCIKKIYTYDNINEYCFRAKIMGYRYADPLTEEEIKKYVLKK